MDRNEISGTIKDYLETEYPVDGVALTGETDLLKEWFVDSIAIVNTVVFLETRFGIRIVRADINANTFRNLDALTDYVVRRMGETA